MNCYITNQPLALISTNFQTKFKQNTDLSALITEPEIARLVQKIADKINDFYAVSATLDDPLQIIGLLTGAYQFASDLARLITVPVQVEFFKVSSYSGEIQQQIQIENDISRHKNTKNVLLVDELWDTGNTVLAVQKVLPQAEICCCFAKGGVAQDKIKFLGVGGVPDVWLLGYGLDCNQIGRTWGMVVVKGVEYEGIKGFRESLKEWL